MENFEAARARLNKKAIAFGLDPIEVVKSTQQRYYWDVRDTSSGGEASMVRLRDGEDPPFGRSITVVNRLSLEYPIVKLGEWEVVGQIEAADGGNLLFSVSADQSDAKQMLAHANCPVGCEHCNVKRTRKLSYLLKGGEGTYKEVGSTCLEDFTGIDPAAALFMQKMYLFWSEYGEEELEGGGGRVTSFPLRGYLARVLFCIEESKGFVSSATARDQGLMATYTHAAGLDHGFRYDLDLRDRFYASYERHADYAQRIVDWWLQSESQDSFTHNTKLLFSREDIVLDNKHLAFAAGAVQGYQRELAKGASASVQSAHVGAVGEKRDEPLTLRSVSSWETHFGLKWRINFTDEPGNRLTWCTASPPDDLLKPQSVGRSFAARFKVKAHDNYRGTATTEVSHLKVGRWLDAENQAGPGLAVLTVRPDTEAFADIGLRQELANIVRSVGETLDDLPDHAVELRDTNGNVVGTMSSDEPDQEPPEDAVRISIKLSADNSGAASAERVALALLAGEQGAEAEDGELVGAIEWGSRVLDCRRDDRAEIGSSELTI